MGLAPKLRCFFVFVFQPVTQKKDIFPASDSFKRNCVLRGSWPCFLVCKRLHLLQSIRAYVDPLSTDRLPSSLPARLVEHQELFSSWVCFFRGAEAK